MLSVSYSLQIKHRLAESERVEKHTLYNINFLKAVIILISDKVDFRVKKIISCKEWHCIIIKKRSIHQERITTINVYSLKQQRLQIYEGNEILHGIFFTSLYPTASVTMVFTYSISYNFYI